MNIQIEQSIPIPARSRHPLGAALGTMEIGESFLMDKQPNGASLAYHKPRKFMTRKVEGGGYRVWRIA